MNTLKVGRFPRQPSQDDVRGVAWEVWVKGDADSLWIGPSWADAMRAAAAIKKCGTRRWSVAA